MKELVITGRYEEKDGGSVRVHTFPVLIERFFEPPSAGYRGLDSSGVGVRMIPAESSVTVSAEHARAAREFFDRVVPNPCGIHGCRAFVRADGTNGSTKYDSAVESVKGA